MKVLYFIQTFKNPAQIYRLVRTIKKSSPESHILISHDFTVSNLDIAPLQDLPEVDLLRLRGKGGRGDFSMIQGYLDAVDWLLSHNTKFDWLINLSGQDYPTQPLPRIEKFLAETKYDGFLEYDDAFSESEHNLWPADEGRTRYLFQYWRSGIHIYGKHLHDKIYYRIQYYINNCQRFMKIISGFDCIMVGIAVSSTPFHNNFLCYRGSYYHTLSNKCVQFLYEFSKQNPDLVEYYKKTVCPNESFIQTVLVNSGLFNLCNESKRYIDFLNSPDSSRPRTLTVEDYSLLLKDNIHFARKFEPGQDSRILDMLDARILQGT